MLVSRKILMEGLVSSFSRNNPDSMAHMPPMTNLAKSFELDQKPKLPAPIKVYCKLGHASSGWLDRCNHLTYPFSAPLPDKIYKLYS